MSKPRQPYSAQDKVAILRLHLLEKKPVSDLCDQYGIHPTLFYLHGGHAEHDPAPASASTGKCSNLEPSTRSLEQPSQRSRTVA